MRNQFVFLCYIVVWSALLLHLTFESTIRKPSVRINQEGQNDATSRCKPFTASKMITGKEKLHF